MNTKDAWNKCPQCGETDTKILSSKQKFDIADILLVIFGLLLMCGGIFLPASDFPPIIFPGLIWKILCIFGGFAMFWVMGLKKTLLGFGFKPTKTFQLVCNKCNNEWKTDKVD